jgi:hypothetical protein
VPTAISVKCSSPSRLDSLHDHLAESRGKGLVPEPVTGVGCRFYLRRQAAQRYSGVGLPETVGHAVQARFATDDV